MSDLDRQGWFSDAIRGLFAKLDSFVYSLISGLYQIFYYVATATIIEGETVRNFYSRVQLILGVIIMFKVAISLFNGIMNPDSLNDNKNGFSSIIKRIVMVLIMLVLMVPLNIPNVGSEDSYDNNSQESWNARMNNNGILFGTLFEIQSRLLSQNTISKLILGDNDNDEEYSLDGSYSGYQLSSIILKSFVTPNVLVDGLDPEDDKNRVCSADALSSQYDDDSYADIYDQYESTMIPSNVLSMVNVSCSPEESIGQKIGTVLGTIATKKALNDLKLRKANDDKLAAEALAEAKVLAKEIEEKQLVLKMKVGEGGRTFGSISTKEIAAEAKKQLGYDLDKKKMHCELIKNLGFHDVTIKVHPQVTATLRVKVEEK